MLEDFAYTNAEAFRFGYLSCATWAISPTRSLKEVTGWAVRPPEVISRYKRFQALSEEKTAVTRGLETSDLPNLGDETASSVSCTPILRVELTAGLAARTYEFLWDWVGIRIGT